MRNTAVLLIDCPDRKGLVAGVANLLYQFGANITHADQHQDPEAELFFMRVEWELAAFDLLRFLLIDCPDRKGLVAGVANLLYQFGANITHADQHQDPEAELFFMRVEWELAAFDLLRFREEFQTLAEGFQMRWRLSLMSQPPRVAIFVS